MAAPFELRPLALGEILDRAFTIYRRHFAVLVGIMLLATIVPGLLMVGAMGVVSSHPVAGLLVMALYLPLGLLGYTAATAATTHAVSAALLGQPLSVGESFESVKSRIPPVLGGTLLMGIGTFLGLLLLVVPGVIALLRWFVLVPVLVLERTPVEGGLRRSWNLTQGSMGRIFAILLLMGSIGVAIGFLLIMPLTMWVAFSRAGSSSPNTMQALIQLLQYVANTLVLPVQSIVTVLIYYDLRIRKEAFDVERLMAGMGGAPSSVPPPLG